ncbi:hypothetical protein HDV06_001832 [Boothiomyces sp. JEL0866]|nr:hypothetical protein HDV06_001832 [Boothiomyces sp. JEL0866]
MRYSGGGKDELFTNIKNKKIFEYEYISYSELSDVDIDLISFIHKHSNAGCVGMMKIYHNNKEFKIFCLSGTEYKDLRSIENSDKFKNSKTMIISKIYNAYEIYEEILSLPFDIDDIKDEDREKLIERFQSRRDEIINGNFILKYNDDEPIPYNSEEVSSKIKRPLSIYSTIILSEDIKYNLNIFRWLFRCAENNAIGELKKLLKYNKIKKKDIKKIQWTSTCNGKELKKKIVGNQISLESLKELIQDEINLKKIDIVNSELNKNQNLIKDESHEWVPSMNKIENSIDVKNIPMILNPVTNKMAKVSAPSIQKLISDGIIDKEGNLLITNKELDELLNIHKAKKLINQNRVFDAITMRLKNMTIHEVYQIMNICKEELINGDRDEEIKEFEKKNKSISRDIDAIKSMRKHEQKK